MKSGAAHFGGAGQDETRIAAVIPALDAAGTLPDVVDGLRTALGDIPIWVVDDGSADGTSRVARELGCFLIRHPQNRGKGAALRSGFFAVEARADLVLTIDADGQHEPKETPRFLQRLRECDLHIVVGDRMSRRGAMPLDRYLSNCLSSAIVSYVAGVAIPDSQCGFRLFRTEVLKGISLRTTHFETESEFLVRAAWAGFRIGTVPIASSYSSQGSHISRWSDTIRFLKLMIALQRERSGLGQTKCKMQGK
ncbi:MAG: glycosyltransferase family 2 protein [Calditrichaeota bacterium]|nr:glycosyltransferase family 2 protein [Calditrichota bacterium]